MPPSFSSSLGIPAGQGLGDFLSLSDTPTLRQKYYDALQGGLDAATQDQQLPQGQLLFQGIIPALATALLTKGGSLAQSGAPLMGVLSNAQKDAADNQKLTVEAKLKGAGLLGDELGKRETLATTIANKEEDRAQKAELAQQNNELKRDLFQQGDETKRYLGESLNDVRREGFQNQSEIADKNIQAGNMRAGAQLLATQQQRGLNEADRNVKNSEAARKDIQAQYEKAINAPELRKKASAVTTLEGLLSDPNEVNVNSAKQTIAVLLHGTRPSAVMADNLIPQDVRSYYQHIINRISNGDENPLSDAKLEDLKKLVSTLKADVHHTIQDGIENTKGSGIGSYLKQTGEYDKTINNLGSEFGDIAKGPGGIVEHKKYKAPNGNILSGADILSQYGNKPDALRYFKEAE